MKYFRRVADYLLLPILFLRNHVYLEKRAKVSSSFYVSNPTKRLSPIVATLLLLLGGSASVQASSYSCGWNGGQTVSKVNGATNTTSTKSYTTNRNRKYWRYFSFKTKADGNVLVTYSHNDSNDYKIEVGTNCSNNDLYNGALGSSDAHTFDVIGDTWYFVRVGSNTKRRLKFKTSFKFTKTPPGGTDTVAIAKALTTTGAIAVGDTVTYRITTTNKGYDKRIQMKDGLPNSASDPDGWGTTYDAFENIAVSNVPAGVSCSKRTGSTATYVECITNADYTHNQSFTVTVTARVKKSGHICNTAHGYAYDSDWKDSSEVCMDASAPANTKPVADPQSVTTDENTAATVTLSGHDDDGDTLTYHVISNPAHGSLSGTAPHLTYTPANGYQGTDSFTFKVNDGTEDSDPATVSITVNPVSTCGGCDCSLDDNNINNTSPGQAIPDLNGATGNVTQCISGTTDNAESSTDKQDYYYFTVNTDGNLSIAATSPNSHPYHLQVGTTAGGDDVKPYDPTSASWTSSPISLHAGDGIYIKVKETGSDLDEYQLSFTFTKKEMPIIENADDLCYEDSTYKGMMCMDMGICKGGIGCKTTYPLKNIGDSDLSDVNVLYDENGMGGSMANNCETSPDGTCSQKNGVDMGPMGLLGTTTSFDFANAITPDQSDAGVSTTATVAMSCLNSDNIYATYVKDGALHRGKLRSCNSVPPPDEEIPDDNITAELPMCGVFEDMFQTRERCTGSNTGWIDIQNAGQTLDGSKDVILNAPDKVLTTCTLATPTWVKNQYQTCGDKGDCTESNSNASGLNIDYNNPPATALVKENVSRLGSDVSVQHDLDLYNTDFDTIKPKNGGVTDYTIDFHITDFLKINEIDTSVNNTYHFTSTSPYDLRIGNFKIKSNGSGTTVTTDDHAKNIKIYRFEQASGAHVELQAAQTIKMDKFYVGRGSTVVLKAPYININHFEPTNSGSGNTVIDIYADYIDMDYIELSQDATVRIHPYTPGKRILFRNNNMTETSSSTILVSTGKYYVNRDWVLPGTSDVSAIRAIDTHQDIDFILNHGLEVGNNPGINAYGNNGNFGDLKPSSFRLYINGSLKTGGGGTTINATVYVEENVKLGNPTYIRGAVNANHKVEVGQGQFIYDQNLTSDGWGTCGCADVRWQYYEYTTKEDTQNPMPPTKLVTPKPTVVLLGGPRSYDINVSYKMVDGTAKAGYDYVKKSGTLTIPKGETNVSLDVEIKNDAPIELAENFFIQLSDPSPSEGVCLDEHNQTKITIDAQTDAPICFNDDFSSYKENDLPNLRAHHWRVLNNPNAGNSYTPRIVTVNGEHRLRLTDRSHNLATVVTKDYKFVTSENLIIVEFDYHAYGGCRSGSNLGDYGADGIVNVLFNSNVGASPVPGSRGGSMGYAQTTVTNPDQNGFEGGWLGLGIDEYGNYANHNEGRVGGPGFRRNYASIRGDGDGINGYEFLAATDAPLNPPIANKYRRDDYYSGRYKFTVDARDKDHLYVRLERSTTGKSKDYHVIMDQFDAKDPQYGQGATPDEVRYAITSGTGGGCNNHELSWIQLRGNCQRYIVEGAFITGPFATTDTFRWGNHRPKTVSPQVDWAISTKKVNQPIQLVIASMNDAGTYAETKEGIVAKYGLFADSGTLTKKLSNTAYEFNATDVSDFVATFPPVNTAQSNAQVHIFYCGEYNATSEKTRLYPFSECVDTSSEDDLSYLERHSITEEDKLTAAGSKVLFRHISDPFAIRPEAFKIFGNNQYKRAGEDFNLTLKAVDETNANLSSGTQDDVKSVIGYAVPFSDLSIASAYYTPTDDEARQMHQDIYGTSVLDKSKVSACPHNGTLNVSSGSFVDGEANVTLKYPETGVLMVTASEINGSEFARIDANDTNDSERFIQPATVISDRSDISQNDLLLMIPYSFETHAQYQTVPTDRNWLYMSNAVKNANNTTPKMAARIQYTVTAKNKQGSVTQNYTQSCFPDTSEAHAPRRNGLKLNSTFDLFLDATLKSDTNHTAISLYTEDNTSQPIWTLHPTTTLTLGSNAIREWISPLQFQNGTGQARVYFNIDRNITHPINPVTVTLLDANTSTSWMGNAGATNLFVGQEINTSKTFFYGRVKPSRFFYDDVTTNTIITPLSVVTYADDPTKITSFGSQLKSTNEYDWYLSTGHTVDDGKVALSTSDVNISIQDSMHSAGPYALPNGERRDVTITYTGTTLPHATDIDMTGTDPWLIYNPDTNATPSPFYRIRFIGTGNWGGTGKTGHVVSGTANTHKTHRLGW